MPSPTKKKLVIITNTITPYRLPIYLDLGKNWNLTIFKDGTENRNYWGPFLDARPNFKIRSSGSLTIKYFKKSKTKKNFDIKFLHIPLLLIPKLILDLPDIIVSVEMGFKSLAAYVVSLAFKRAFYIWWGGTIHSERNCSWLRSKVRKIFFKSKCKWIAYGDEAQAYLVSMGVDQSRIVKIQNTVNEQIFTKKVKANLIPSINPSFLTIGQMVSRKGWEPLVDAIIEFNKLGKPSSFYFVGEGPERIRLEKTVFDNKISNIFFLNYVEYNNTPNLYHSFDFLIMPTLEDIWGLVVNEAIWSGLNVICSKYAGCSSEIVPKTSVFDPLDKFQFAKLIETAAYYRLEIPDLAKLRTSDSVSSQLSLEFINRL